jgi:hypothetical protein
MLCRSAHTRVKTGLDKLAEAGFLFRDSAGLYWFAAGCKAPEGCRIPLWALNQQTSNLAGPRVYVAKAMPDDDTPESFTKQGSRFDYLRHPSRRGDRLYYSDGRVTDLDGRPIEAFA